VTHEIVLFSFLQNLAHRRTWRHAETGADVGIGNFFVRRVALRAGKLQIRASSVLDLIGFRRGRCGAVFLLRLLQRMSPLLAHRVISPRC
jgi:hypothetical protein